MCPLYGSCNTFPTFGGGRVPPEELRPTNGHLTPGHVGIYEHYAHPVVHAQKLHLCRKSEKTLGNLIAEDSETEKKRKGFCWMTCGSGLLARS